jgi:hypothetical protein
MDVGKFIACETQDREQELTCLDYRRLNITNSKKSLYH